MKIKYGMIEYRNNINIESEKIKKSTLGKPGEKCDLV